MSINPVYEFFFHPFSHFNPQSKIFSALTCIALTVLTAGIYLGIVAMVNLHERITPPPPEAKKVDQVREQTFPKHVEKSREISRITHLKAQHAKQLRDFEKWAKEGNWEAFHAAHYDWWMFPITRVSRGYGEKYAFSKPELEQLKADQGFMQAYRRGVELVLLSLGWDLKNSKPVANPTAGQRWRGYEVRLGKMADSLNLLGEKELFDKVRNEFVRIHLEEPISGAWVRHNLQLDP